MEVRATRDVAEGEELYVSYLALHGQRRSAFFRQVRHLAEEQRKSWTTEHSVPWARRLRRLRCTRKTPLDTCTEIKRVSHTLG